MTVNEMREESKDYGNDVDWKHGSETLNVANMICSALWLVGAEICERLDSIDNNLGDIDRNLDRLD